MGAERDFLNHGPSPVSGPGSQRRAPNGRAVFLLLLAIYAITGEYSGGLRHNIDTVASAAPAQRFVTDGDFDMTEFRHLSQWFVQSGDMWVTNRPPGPTLVALPFYAVGLSRLPSGIHVVGPSAVAAIVISALAMALLFLGLRRVVEPAFAFVTTLVFALTTPTWSISATAIWPHGPDQFAIAGILFVLLLRRSSWALAPLAALGIMSRPLMVVPLIVIGAWMLARRDWRSSGWMLMGGVVGVAGLVLWDTIMFPGASSPYTNAFADNPEALTASVYATRLAGVLLDPLRGIFFVTPIIPAAVWFGLRSGRRLSPEMRIAAAAGVAYLLVHLTFNRFNPGFRTGYRYPLETITLLAPIVALGLQRAARSQAGRLALGTMAMWGLFFQAAHVFEFTEIFGSSPDWLPWSHNP